MDALKFICEALFYESNDHNTAEFSFDFHFSGVGFSGGERRKLKHRCG
jgi:hypothetical protein